MSVVVLSPGVPHRLRGASSVLFFQYIAGIAATGCRLLHVLLIDDSNADDRALQEYMQDTAAFPNMTVVPCVMRRLYGLHRWSRMPYVGAFSPEVLDRIERFAPDRIVAFDLLCAAYASSIRSSAKRVVWLGDLNFETFWYHALYDVRERLWTAVWLPLAGIQCLQWKAFYRRTLTGVPSVVVASKSSEASMRELGVPAKYLPYPWPVSSTLESGLQPPGKPTFVFFGALSGLGSRSAFHSLLTDIYPELVKIWGAQGFEVVLAGSRQMPSWVEQALRDKPEIVFRGFVDDLEKLLAGAHAALIPIAVPVGNRSRIVTAMAHRALVIAHRHTAKGNPDLISGQNCLLAASPGEFVAHLRFAVEHRAEAAEIGRRARETYLRQFLPANAVAKLLDEIAA